MGMQLANLVPHRSSGKMRLAGAAKDTAAQTG